MLAEAERRLGTYDGTWLSECELRDEEWLVEQLVPAQSYTGIFGRRGSAKSFLALELACCGASGLPFLGKRTWPFGTIYCVGEKKARFEKRVVAWRENHATGYGLPVQFVYRVPNLLDENEVAEFIHFVETQKAGFEARGAPPEAHHL